MDWTIFLIALGLGVAGFGFFSKIINFSKLKNLLKFTEKKGELTEKINQLEVREKILKEKIEKDEKISTETKVKINTIIDNANEEIGKAIKEDKISKIHEGIEKEWENL